MPRNGMPTEVLVAPDSFKGTFTAPEVAAAIGSGLSAAGREVSLCPVADGGEGTLDALAGPLGLELTSVAATDPVGRPVSAAYGLGGSLAVVEMAAASGLGLVTGSERDALGASSAGTGQLIRAAIDAGARTVLVAVGGSATSDGGAGAIAALGSLDGARLIVLSDVQTPFELAGEVYGPQKGASPTEVLALTERLHVQAAGFPRDPRGRPMTGAAGGLAGGLWAALGAELQPGAPYVLERLGFHTRMRAARAVIVGEGRMDRQTLAGKIAGEIATRARQSGVPCLAVVGQNGMDRFDQRILDLQAILEATNLAELEVAGRALAEQI